MTRRGSNTKTLIEDSIGNTDGGMAPAMSVSENVPINPIIASNTPDIIRFWEVFAIPMDYVKNTINVSDNPPLKAALQVVMIGDVHHRESCHPWYRRSLSDSYNRHWFQRPLP